MVNLLVFVVTLRHSHSDHIRRKGKSFPLLPPPRSVCPNIDSEMARERQVGKSGWDVCEKSIEVEGLWNLLFSVARPLNLWLALGQPFPKWQIVFSQKFIHFIYNVEQQCENEEAKEKLKFHLAMISKQKYQMRNIKNHQRASRHWKCKEKVFSASDFFHLLLIFNINNTRTENVETNFDGRCR